MVKEPTVMPEPDYRWPKYDNVDTPAKIKVENITRIGFVVRNLEETIKNYWTILGIGPWDIIQCVPPVVHDITYMGNPGNFTMKIASANAGKVKLEVIEPMSGDNIYRDFLAEHGEGLHHIQFHVNNQEETAQIMNRQGFQTMMRFGFLDGISAYYDTRDALKSIWEISQVFNTQPQMTRYP